jgi:glycine/D-amino acid oxidase-like deaminating enzyme
MPALRQAATCLGVDWTTAQVTGVSQSGAAAEVTTADTTFAADAVIIAAGSWSSELSIPPSPAARAAARQAPSPRPLAPSPVRPIRGQLVHLRLDHQPLSRAIWGTGCYLVPWRDGSLLVGATVEDVGFDESTTPEAVRTLARAAAALVPEARGARIHDVRVGLRPKTPDGLPAIGRSSTMPGVFYATGHYRTGVLLAPLTAALIADLVLDRREDPALALVRPDRLGL